jgi:uncharacterized membrane protein YgcG
MTKGIIKEIIIVLLLIFAILLILGVVLYKYVPSNKQLPESIAYSTPANVKEKLVSIEGVDEDQVILTYELNQADLYNYQRINEYKPGKSNPFSSYETPKPEEKEGSGSGSSNGGSSSSGSGSSSSPSSTQTKDNTYTAPTSQGGVNPGTYTNKSGTK